MNSQQPITMEQLRDVQTGPLAEVEALADLLEIVAADNAQTLRQFTLATLSHMLTERLVQIREVIESSGVVNG